MDSVADLLYERLKAHSSAFHKVVDFNPAKEKLIHFNLTGEDAEFQNLNVTDTTAFEIFINDKLKMNKAKFGIGGYNENRHLYNRSLLFAGVEPRTLHLGMDIWGQEGTKVYAPLGGLVHSFAFNNNFGDYGATLILLHQLDSITFYTLYGHLSLADIASITEFQYVIRGQVIGHFGKPEENGNWPPHLHFQVIQDIWTKKGDYPGVCKLSESEKYLANSPNPNAILNMMEFVND